jgi:hypothetical protein
MVTTRIAKGTSLTHAELDDNFNQSVTNVDDQSISGIKTFTSSPLVPTPSLDDDSLAAASTAFVSEYFEAGATDLIAFVTEAIADIPAPAAVVLTENIDVTVGVGGDYTDLQSCIDYCNSVTDAATFTITVTILNGYVITEQVQIINMNLGHVIITMQTPELASTAYNADVFVVPTTFMQVLDNAFNIGKHTYTLNDDAIPLIFMKNSIPPQSMHLTCSFSGVFDFCGYSTNFCPIHAEGVNNLVMDIQFNAMHGDAEFWNCDNMLLSFYHTGFANDHMAVNFYTCTIGEYENYIPKTHSTIDHCSAYFVGCTVGYLVTNNSYFVSWSSKIRAFIYYNYTSDSNAFYVDQSDIVVDFDFDTSTVTWNDGFAFYMERGSTVQCKYALRAEGRNHLNQFYTLIPYTPSFSGIYLGGELDPLNSTD